MSPAGSTPAPSVAADAAGEDTLVALQVPARAGSLKLVRAVLGPAAAELGFDQGAADDLVLAVDEACQNVVRHAFAGVEPGTLTVRIARAGDMATVRLIDDAPTVDPATIRPRPLEDLRPGGLGTRLMGELLDEIVYETPPAGAGNVLKLSKRIG